MKSAEPPLPAALQTAVQNAREALGAGKLDRAAEHCRRALAASPGSAQALGLMGEIEYRLGRAEAAGDWLEKALKADRRDARAHWLLGNINQDQGKFDRAITSYRRALRANPDLGEAHNDLGTAYFAKGWHQEAEQCYRRSLELQPDNFAATENLAAVLRAQGKLREARDAFIRALKLRLVLGLRKLFRRPARRTPAASHDAARSALLAAAKALLAAGDGDAAQRELREWLARRPEDPEALQLLGVALGRGGRRGEAIAQLERAVALRSSAPELRLTLGELLAADRQYVKAIEAYQAALMLDPGNAPATSNIARILYDLGHYREAEEIYRLGLQRDPDTADTHSNLAATLLSLGRYADAEKTAREALQLNARSVHALVVLASALMRQGRIEQAQATIREGEAIDPDNVLILRWRALFKMVLHGDFAAAESDLRRAEQLAPDDPSVHVDLAQSLLARQRFAQGWEEYEWRKRDPARAYVYSRFPYREWDGAPLEGKAIAINGEQGLGDEIMFASCLGEIAPRARRCVLYCNRRLETLFRRSFPSVEVIGGSHLGAADPFPVAQDIDCIVAAGSLPRALRRAPGDFPDHRGYLRADGEKTQRWRRELSALGPGLKIGLSWIGGTPLSEGGRRTLTLEQLLPVLRVPGVQWVNLQHGDSSAERAALAARHGLRLHHWQDAVDDLDETTALICALDLRISVCNTQVHLSGAAGKEVWVLAPYAPDWRYLYRDESMLWYPAARMFRQRRPGDWPPVIERAAGELADRARR